LEREDIAVSDAVGDGGVEGSSLNILSRRLAKPEFEDDAVSVGGKRGVDVVVKVRRECLRG
jgi:hypothetical protein